MLILTRITGELITIGEEITVTILETRGNQVRIAVDAPKDVPILREDVYYKMRHERAGHEH